MSVLGRSNFKNFKKADMLTGKSMVLSILGSIDGRNIKGAVN